MFRAKELQTAKVYVSIHREGLFMPSKPCIRTRKIALRNENVFQMALFLEDKSGSIDIVTDNSFGHTWSICQGSSPYPCP